MRLSSSISSAAVQRAFTAAALSAALTLAPVGPAFADLEYQGSKVGQDKQFAAGVGAGAEKAENSKIQGGGASTLQQGRRITITRGVNLDNTQWSGEDLKGVAFQQSVGEQIETRAHLFPANTLSFRSLSSLSLC